jgi:hypothetical protein
MLTVWVRVPPGALELGSTKSRRQHWLPTHMTCGYSANVRPPRTRARPGQSLGGGKHAAGDGGDQRLVIALRLVCISASKATHCLVDLVTRADVAGDH